MSLKPKIKVLTEKNTEHGLEISYADIFSFEFLPDNIKSHDLQGIEESIVKFGFVEPILVNKNTNFDISGNGRLTVLRKMFESDVDAPKGIIEKEKVIEAIGGGLYTRKWFAPVVLLDISEEEESILAIKLNRTNEKGGLNYQKAYEVLIKLKSKSEDSFAATGFDAKSLEHIQLLAKFRDKVDNFKDDANEESNSEQDDSSEPSENICIELNRKWNVGTGDIFQIGNHRLICGNSRDLVTYQKLIADAKVRLVFSSPPYDNQRIYEFAEKLDWTGLMNDVSKNLQEVLLTPSDILFNLGILYRDSEAQFYWNDWLAYCKNELKHPLFGFYVWDKMRAYPGEWNGRLSPAHEFFFHFSFGKVSANKWIEKNESSLRKGPANTGLRNKDGTFSSLSSPDTLEQPFKIPESVIRIGNEMSRGIHTQGHPATFPVALPSFIIKTWSIIGDVICDPFLGSGTTMVACQEIDRVCLGIELSPNYCALVLERMHRQFPSLEIKKL